MKEKRRMTTLEYLLISLIPYSKPNLKLVFSPHRFFNDLEKISTAKRKSLQVTLSRARSDGLVERVDGVPVLTEKGRERIRTYQTKKLPRHTRLMVIFDIPEEVAFKRRTLRNFLKLHEFIQVQKSVWLSDMDYTEPLCELIENLKIKSYVQIFECARIQ